MGRRLHPRKKWWLLRAIQLCDSSAPTMVFMVTSFLVAGKRCCVTIVTNPLIGCGRHWRRSMILYRSMMVSEMSVTMIRRHGNRTRWWRGHVTIRRWRGHHSSVVMSPRRRIRLRMLLVMTMRESHRSKSTASTRESWWHPRSRRSKARGKTKAAYTFCPLVFFDPRSETHAFLTGRSRKTCFRGYRGGLFDSRRSLFPRSNTSIFGMIRSIVVLGFSARFMVWCFFRLRLRTKRS